MNIASVKTVMTVTLILLFPLLFTHSVLAQVTIPLAEYDSLKNQVKRLPELNDRLERLIADTVLLAKEIEKKERDNTRLIKNLNSTEENLKAEKENVDRLKERNRTQTTEIERLEGQLSDAQQILSELRPFKTEAENLRQDNNTLKQQNEDLVKRSNDHDELLAAKKELENSKAELRQQVEKQESDITKLEQDYRQAQNENETLRADKARIRTNIKDKLAPTVFREVEQILSTYASENYRSEQIEKLKVELDFLSVMSENEREKQKIAEYLRQLEEFRSITILFQEANNLFNKKYSPDVAQKMQNLRSLNIGLDNAPLKAEKTKLLEMLEGYKSANNTLFSIMQYINDYTSPKNAQLVITDELAKNPDILKYPYLKEKALNLQNNLPGVGKRISLEKVQ